MKRSPFELEIFLTIHWHRVFERLESSLKNATSPLLRATVRSVLVGAFLLLISGFSAAASCGVEHGHAPALDRSALPVARPAGGAAIAPIGSWGGVGVSARVTETGAHFEFDCAFGSTDGPIRLDENGAFAATGGYAFELGGPRTKDSPSPNKHEALFEGRVEDERMTLTITLSEQGRTLGPFELERNRRAQLDKCV